MISISGSLSAAPVQMGLSKPPAASADDKPRTAAPAASAPVDTSSAPVTSSRVGAYLALDMASSSTGRADSDGETGPDNDGDADDAGVPAAGSGNPGVEFDEAGTYSPAASN